MTNAINRRSNRIPKSPRSYRRAFARTVRNAVRGMGLKSKPKANV